jgi:O-antigen ligase
VCAVLAAAVVGAIAPSISSRAVIGLLVGVVAFSGGAMLWRRFSVLSRLTVLREQTTLTSTSDIADDGRYRDPRLLLYLGLLTSCWLQLRVHGVTLSDALFGVATVWAFYDLAKSRERTPALPIAMWVGIGLFVAGGAISTAVNSLDRASSVGVIARVFYLIAAWFWLAATTLRTREHVWRALECWTVSAAVCGLWALGQKYGHLPGDVESGRFAGLSDGANDLGALCACALVPALALMYRRPTRHRLTIIAGIAVGLIISGSIGAGIAALVALLFGFVSRELTKVTAVTLAVGVLAMVFASPLIGYSAISRFSTSVSATALYNQNTLSTRVTGYEQAWEHFTHDPLLGTGLDLKSSELYDPSAQTYYQVHNLFIGALYEAGILGFCGVVVLMWSIGVAAWRLVLRSGDRLLALALMAGFIAYLGTEMSEPSLYKRYSLVPALLIMGYRAWTLRVAPTPLNRAPERLRMRRPHISTSPCGLTSRRALQASDPDLGRRAARSGEGGR